jgi:hypothetical protein
MRSRPKTFARFRRAGLALLTGLPVSACTTYEIKHEIGWDSRDQIWRSDASQVQLRAAQSRVFDTVDRARVLEAVVSTLQDLDFQVEVLDEALGIVSGTRFLDDAKPRLASDPFYHFYDDKSLMIFTKTYRTWGPFWHRSDLVRLTVTVRERNETQLVVRASAQYYLRAVADAEPYQKFFRTLQQSMFVEGRLVQ